MDKTWTVSVTGQMLQEMDKSFDLGPMLDLAGTRSINEAQVSKLKGLKIEIFSNEHPPPHFRVSYNGETANFRIKDCIKINGKLDKWEKNIKAWHTKNKDKLILHWNKSRPSNCPVGDYKE